MCLSLCLSCICSFLATFSLLSALSSLLCLCFVSTVRVSNKWISVELWRFFLQWILAIFYHDHWVQVSLVWLQHWPLYTVKFNEEVLKCNELCFIFRLYIVCYSSLFLKLNQFDSSSISNKLFQKSCPCHHIPHCHRDNALVSNNWSTQYVMQRYIIYFVPIQNWMGYFCPFLLTKLLKRH